MKFRIPRFALPMLLMISSFFASSHVEAAPAPLPANKALIARLYAELYNRHDLSQIDSFFAPGFIHRDARGDQPRAAIKAVFEPTFAAFSDWQASIEQVVAEGDRVLVLVTWTGTHDGALRGYPATGKRVQVRTADLYRIADGQIVEHWDVASPLDLMQQIGLLEFKTAGKP